ncbi:hypothetical protein [Candidatus Magnetaquicoccus inordinatus]|uniref:hypothetical protein n=1 Tax=Candidatus Magnetaquicoccus inordinatus TaxID=2496818 RepID=UPI00102D162D|nr:hypothetical protein [Candidatus Magnetaquicoccus inordinatus]
MDSSRGFWVSPLMEAEQKLWVAVLETALNDALSGSNPARRETARRWFREGGQNFRLVCDLANFDPDFVRLKLLAVIDRQDSDQTVEVKTRRRVSKTETLLLQVESGI